MENKIKIASLEECIMKNYRIDLKFINITTIKPEKSF